MALKLSKKDFDSAQEFVNKEFTRRKDNTYRKKHEIRWAVVDRLIYMEEMEKTSKSGEENDVEWRSAVEIGEISVASEVLSADIERLSFPEEWFAPHSDVPMETDEQGNEIQDADRQEFTDTTLKSIMLQQHKDFGFKQRVGLSVKEALHHGSYVAEVIEETLLDTDLEGVVESKKSPVWVAHSMWNCFPEASNNPIYDKSMIILSYMKLEEAKKQKHWMNKDKIESKTKKDDEDVEILTYWGDMPITRSGKQRFIPNVKIVLANDIIVFSESSKTKYKNIIYNGYERLDVRDPYYVSPLMKQSANQVMASTLINKFIDGVGRVSEPPTDYLESDDFLTSTGGPSNAPGALNPVSNLDNIRERSVGDPSAALSGYKVMLTQMQKGLSVDPNRAGVSGSADVTAFEVSKSFKQAEIRTVKFVGQHEQFGLKPFLIMQHEFNKKGLKDYPFFNKHPEAPDFETASADDLPKDVLFEITGSRGVLGEEERATKSQQWTAFLLSNPMTAPKVNISAIAKQGYEDAGVKEPERFVNVSKEDDAMEQQFQQQLQQMQQQAEGQIQAISQQLQQMQKDLLKSQVTVETDKIKQEELRLQIEQRDSKNAQLTTDINEVNALLTIERASERLTSTRQ